MIPDSPTPKRDIAADKMVAAIQKRRAAELELAAALQMELLLPVPPPPALQASYYRGE